MIDIIIPTFNEECIIELFLRTLSNELKGEEFRVIIVDDSTDNTCLIARQACVDLNLNAKIIKRTDEKGKGSAVNRGLKELEAGKGVIIDADLEYHPEYIKPMLGLLKKGDLITSIRRKETPWYRRITSSVFRLIVLVLFNIPFETQSGLKVFNSEKVNDIDLISKAWVWDVELIYKLLNKGGKLCTYKITQTQRVKGESKIGFFTPFEMFIDLIKLRIKL